MSGGEPNRPTRGPSAPPDLRFDPLTTGIGVFAAVTIPIAVFGYTRPGGPQSADHRRRRHARADRRNARLVYRSGIGGRSGLPRTPALEPFLRRAPGGATRRRAGAGGWAGRSGRWPPVSLDMIGSQIALSPSGTAGIGYGVQDEDNPGPRPRLRPAARQASTRRPAEDTRSAADVLGLAYEGSERRVAGRRQPSRAAVLQLRRVHAQIGSRDGFGGARKLVSGSPGADPRGKARRASGHRMLAAIATERGVWIPPDRGWRERRGDPSAGGLGRTGRGDRRDGA